VPAKERGSIGVGGCGSSLARSDMSVGWQMNMEANFEVASAATKVVHLGLRGAMLSGGEIKLERPDRQARALVLRSRTRRLCLEVQVLGPPDLDRGDPLRRERSSLVKR
jgi:hypothetical protein